MGFNFAQMTNGIFTQYEAEVRARANDIANAIYDIRAALWSQVDTGAGDVRETRKLARLSNPVSSGTPGPIDVYTVPKGSRAVLKTIMRDSASGNLWLYVDDVLTFALPNAATSATLEMSLRGGERVSLWGTVVGPMRSTINLEVFTPQVPLVGKPTGVEPETGSRWTSDGLAKQTPSNTVVPQGPESMGS